MVKNKYVQFCLFIAFVIVSWNLIQFIFNREAYQFGLSTNMIMPLTVAIVMGYMVFIREK